jgi:hypothetical protein
MITSCETSTTARQVARSAVRAPCRRLRAPWVEIEYSSTTAPPRSSPWSAVDDLALIRHRTFVLSEPQLRTSRGRQVSHHVDRVQLVEVLDHASATLSVASSRSAEIVHRDSVMRPWSTSSTRTTHPKWPGSALVRQDDDSSSGSSAGERAVPGRVGF